LPKPWSRGQSSPAPNRQASKRGRENDKLPAPSLRIIFLFEEKQDVTPTWQVALAWGYAGISGIVALLGAWVRKWWGSLLLLVAGLGLIAYAYTTVNVVISNRLANFSISLEGVSVVGEGIIINAAQQPGHEMAYIAGGMLVALAVVKAAAAFFTRKKPLKSCLQID
jgi:hypothetical protein